MGQSVPLDFECAECGEILRAMLNDFHVDRRHLRQQLRNTADASGRSVDQMRQDWIESVKTMPPDEQMTLVKAHFPRLSEARRRKGEHEKLTGHALHTHGWARVFGRKPFGGRWPRT